MNSTILIVFFLMLTASMMVMIDTQQYLYLTMLALEKKIQRIESAPRRKLIKESNNFSHGIA